MSEIKYIGKNILNHDLIVRKGNVSGSAESTGSFGHVLGHSVEAAYGRCRCTIAGIGAIHETGGTHADYG